MCNLHQLHSYYCQRIGILKRRKQFHHLPRRLWFANGRLQVRSGSKVQQSILQWLQWSKTLQLQQRFSSFWASLFVCYQILVFHYQQLFEYYLRFILVPYDTRFSKQQIYKIIQKSQSIKLLFEFLIKYMYYLSINNFFQIMSSINKPKTEQFLFQYFQTKHYQSLILQCFIVLIVLIQQISLQQINYSNLLKFLFSIIRLQRKPIQLFFSHFLYISQKSLNSKKTIMDDLFLYNHIKQAIKQRKHFSKDTQEGNFAQKYCRRQLMKKKLNVNNSPSSHHSGSKMKNLMKNFAHVDTYIDLNDLLFSINLIRSKQQAEKQLQKVQQKQRVSRLSKVRNIGQYNSPTPISNFSSSNTQTSSPQMDAMEALKDKVRIEINEMMKRKNQNQTNDLDQLIQNLESESDLLNSLLKNNSGNYISYLNQQLERIQKDEQIDGQACPDNWRIFKQLNQTLNQPSHKEDKKQYFRSTNLNSKEKKQENQLLHKITTFLQIALQNQHKQKWATKDMRKFRSTHGSFRFKKNDAQRSKFFLKGIQIEKENKEVFQKQVSTKTSLTKKNSVFMRKIKSQQRNIFGKKSLQKENLNMSHFSILHQQKIKKKKQNQNNSDYQQNQFRSSPFKTFDRKVSDIRNTAPINRSKFIESLNKQSNFQQLQIYNTDSAKNPTQLFQTQPPAVLRIKKEYQLNKKRKNRNYNFVSPQRTLQSKTTFFGQTQNTIFQQNNSSCEQFSSFTADNFNHTSQNNLKNKTTKNSSFDRRNVQPLIKSPTLFKSTSSKPSNISQSFTFKNRNKKQQILKKLESFIDQVNYEQKISKLQNEYYDSAINHLHDLSKTAYKNYEPEALAGQQEINQLKKFVNNINPSLRKNHSTASGGKRGMR